MLILLTVIVDQKNVFIKKFSLTLTKEILFCVILNGLKFLLKKTYKNLITDNIII